VVCADLIVCTVLLKVVMDSILVAGGGLMVGIGQHAVDQFGMAVPPVCTWPLAAALEQPGPLEGRGAQIGPCGRESSGMVPEAAAPSEPDLKVPVKALVFCAASGYEMLVMIVVRPVGLHAAPLEVYFAE